LGFSFDSNPMLPYPCLSFTRLRDEGIAAACEADVCAMLSTMLLQEISRKSSFMSNISSVNRQASTVVLRHCVAPLKLMGYDAPSLPYNLRDYHGMGRGVTPEVGFPAGVEVSVGEFSKDLKSFALWPGRIQAGSKDDQTAIDAETRSFCSNGAKVKIKDVDGFFQNIMGIHHVMVAGNHAKAVRDALLGMKVKFIGPSDFAAPG
jgi:L-fucose isomerase-like protein